VSDKLVVTVVDAEAEVVSVALMVTEVDWEAVPDWDIDRD